MKYLKKIILMGIFSTLFGCSDRESLGGNYLYDKSENKVLYRYATGGALLPSYKTVPSKHPKTFKVLSQDYAVDKTNVFWAGKLVENAVSEGFEIVEDYPSTFGKNPISQQIIYQDVLVDMDFASTQIRSRKYLVDKNKVLYIASKGREKYGLFHQVTVSDPANFRLFSTKSQSGVLGYDAKNIYIKTLNTHIPSENAQIINYHFPIILQNDVLHYLYPSYRDIKKFNTLPPNFVATANGSIGTFGYDTYYHFSVAGFDQAKQLAESDWINDNNGLYFINDRKIHKIADKPLANYTYDGKYPNFIRTPGHLLEVVVYPFKVNEYPSNAVIFDDDIVRVDNTIYKDGEALSTIDAKTFAPLKSSGYVDKDFYYEGHRLWTKRPIPAWAYQALLNGKNPNDFFGIEMKYEYTVHKTYWNGFLVSLSIPTKVNNSTEILIDFKNIERQTLQLSQPIEQQLYISYTPHNTLSPVYYRDTNVTIKPQSAYDYQNISLDESIQFSLMPNQEMIKNYTVAANTGQTVAPSLVLSSNAFPLARQVSDLYLKASIEKQTNNEKSNTMNEEQNIIERIKAFTEKADALETQAFNDSSYQANGFVEDFNALFDEYAYGKQNRTLSGLNFRQPPRYDNLKYAIKAESEQLSKTRYQVTFWAEPKVKSLRFIVDKKLGEWQIVRFETFVGISNQTKTKGEEIWRKHKL